MREQRIVSEARRRVLQEGPAGNGERPPDALLPGLGVERRRSARRVVPGDRLSFQQDHSAVGGQLIGGCGSGDTAADDEEVCRLGHFRDTRG
jgi:hypothetical protein